jgi:hypothetical protein
LEGEEKRLRQKIVEELERVDGYEQCLAGRDEEFIDSREYKRMLIRKIYRIMKKKGRHVSLSEIRERAINDCEKFFNCETNVGSLIRFIKHKMETPHD